MRQLLALLLFVPSLCLAQLPDYVPTTDLVIWLDFEESDPTSCSTGTSLDCEDYYSFGTDRLGGNALITGNSCFHLPEVQSVNSDWTFSCWMKAGSQSTIGNLFREHWDGGTWLRFEGNSTSTLTFMHGTQLLDFGNGSAFLDDEWHHIVAISASDHASIYGDGQLLASGPSSLLIEWEEPFLIGSALPPGSSLGSGCAERLNGQMDDIGIWNHALDASEVLALFIGTPPVYGCTNASACNYDSLANSDDGSCVSCEVLASACGEGTVWDTTLLACVGVSAPPDTVFIEPEACAPSCGEGTVWDPVNEECIIAVPTDSDFDGCVTPSDLLNLLATFGTCPPIPEWPDEPTDTTWACGDPLTYWDYDYATVLIGDQCWFAENLCNEQFANGDSIPNVTDNVIWEGLSFGAQCDYDNNPTYLSTYGKLYNWYATVDTRGLCPIEWHVSSEAEWAEILELIYYEGFPGSQGEALKSTSGWNYNGNGVDSFGYLGLPGGLRLTNGNYGGIGNDGYWWTSSPATLQGSFGKAMTSGASDVFLGTHSRSYGFSARCVRNKD